MGVRVTPAEVVGRNVRFWRNRRCLTQGQLGEMARIPRPNVCGLERGSRGVSLPVLVRLASALSVSVAQLVDGLDEHDPPWATTDRLIEAGNDLVEWVEALGALGSSCGDPSCGVAFEMVDAWRAAVSKLEGAATDVDAQTTDVGSSVTGSHGVSPGVHGSEGR